MSFWDNVREFFGVESNNKKNNVDTSQYKDKEKELIEQLEKIDKEYRQEQNSQKVNLDEIMPKEPNYEFIEYQGDDEKTIENKVEQMFGQQLEVDKNGIGLDYENKKNTNKQKVETVDEQAKQELLDLQNKYQQLKENNKSDILQKGLARSSIIAESQKAIDDVKEQKESLVKQEFQNQVDKINRQLELLEKQENQAIAELDLHYASKINDKIKALKDERKKSLESIEKYNNSVIEKTNNYKIDREKAIQDYIHKNIVNDRKTEEDEAKNGYSGDKKNNYDNRLNLAIDFYSSLPKEAAKQMVNNNSYLQTYLGYNYGKLISHIANK